MRKSSLVNDEVSKSYAFNSTRKSDLSNPQMVVQLQQSKQPPSHVAVNLSDK